MATSEKKPQQRQTWLTAFGEVWEKRYGGAPPYGVLAKVLRPLIAAHGVETVTLAWRNYCEQTGAAYTSIPKFGATFGVWTGEKPAAGDKSQAELDMIDGWADEERNGL